MPQRHDTTDTNALPHSGLRFCHFCQDNKRLNLPLPLALVVVLGQLADCAA
jgi:hypothetical protein